MCELFGFSSKHPLPEQDLPLAEFRQHADANPDGWGIAWRQGLDLKLEKEPTPGHTSTRFSELIHTLQSSLILAHIRRATFPPVNTLGNTHPFLHTCCDRPWAFAHNGNVPEVVASESAECNAMCHPDGQTDSEFAFCHLLRHLTGHYHSTGSGDDWLGILGAVSEHIAAHGKFNFLLSDGQLLIAYGHDRLHYQHLAQAHNGPAVMVATEPLGDATAWTAFAPGELRIYQDGVLLKQLLTHPNQPQAA
jgi:glutamine amidotransferase